ncbi:phosphotransferase enzyme family-domain-containing protein [Phialemonium atrogriseum]|uniref:non-specific serine/threonine protein kinase n=1 Tax=Phialemonium atrogriseum TaxID=1093897 RepID=A0AAJ0BZS8_9PEZI|nr:phosphotransferase enzyme family-domain-containing protein [Phialemonium atrogriseum]KAK1767543.1 phosphotransferase enzyme family-domain-containing protein [Phialemonium atrogriseum]
MAGTEFQGLQWVTKTIGLEPTWTLEPDLEAAKQLVESISMIEAGTINMSLLAQGAFNKLCDITMSKKAEALILRVALPVDPRYKTLSEVATMDRMRHNTNVPVPRVLAYEASRANPVGFEWILMAKLPGKPLADAWKSLSYPAKEGLAKRFAAYSSSLFKNQLSGIGNIYTASPPKVDWIVSMHFFWGDHIHQDVRRGPFSSSKDWMEARLALSEHDCRSTLAKYPDRSGIDSDDEDDIDDAQRTLEIIKRLVPLVGQILPIDHLEDEPSMFFHDDLSRHNILVDDSGALTGVVDWECVSALPRWKACYYPSFLEGPPRDTKPDPTRYQRTAGGEPADLYWEHLMEYELTTLRMVFLGEMARLEPGWVDVFNSSTMQRDLDLAVQNCDNEFIARRIHDWIDDVAARRSNPHSLRDRIDES